MNLYLYLLIRNDLPSLNAGKAVAHGAHAANQFAHSMYSKKAKIGQREDFDIWQNSTPLGFGTTIALSVNLIELRDAVHLAQMCGFSAGETVDPSYPYTVTAEVARLIQHSKEYPPYYKSPTEVICFREETTAGYVFGAKDELLPIVGRFPLMP